MEAIHDELVEISHEIQNEIVSRIIQLIKHERKRRSLWMRFKLFLSRFKRCSCICGVSGIGCQCEQAEPPQVLPPVIKWKSDKCKNRAEMVEVHIKPSKTSSIMKEGEEGDHNQSQLTKRSSITSI